MNVLSHVLHLYPKSLGMFCFVLVLQITTIRWTVIENQSLAADQNPTEGERQDIGRRDGESTFPIPNGHLDRLTVLRFSSDGRTLVSAGGDRTVRKWDIATGEQTELYEYLPQGHPGEVVMSPDGQFLVSSAHDNTLTIWDLSAGKLRANLEGHGLYSHSLPVQISPDGSQVVTWGEDHQIRWWNAADGKPLAKQTAPGFSFPHLKDLMGMPNRAPYGKFSDDAKILLIQFQGQFYEFETTTGRERRKFKVDGSSSLFHHFAISPDQRRLVTCQTSRDPATNRVNPERVLTVYDFESLEKKRQLKLPGIYMSPLLFSPDSQGMVNHTGETGRAVEIVNLQSGLATTRIPNVPRCTAFQFTPDGKKLAAALEDSTILLWDISKFRTDAK